MVGLCLTLNVCWALRGMGRQSVDMTMARDLEEKGLSPRRPELGRLSAMNRDLK